MWKYPWTICTSKNTYNKYMYIIQEICSESKLWLKVHREAFGYEFILGAVYLSHEGFIHYHDEIYDNAANDIVTMNCKYDVPVLMISDFNSRTGMMEDVIFIEDLVVPTADGIELADKDFVE